MLFPTIVVGGKVAEEKSLEEKSWVSEENWVRMI